MLYKLIRKAKMIQATSKVAKIFICERCGHDAKTKQNLITHLKKQKQCPTKESQRSREDIIKELMPPPATKEKTSECEYCNKRFTTPVGKCKHKKICNQRPEVLLQTEVNTLKQQMAEMQKRWENSQVNTSNIHTTNTQNNYINTVNININSFGQETTSHLTNDFLNHCLLNPCKGLTNLIEKIHYNTELPENHNIRHKSTKQQLLQKYIDNGWHDCDASNTLDELIRKGYRILSSYYASHIANDPNIVEDELRARMYERFRFLCDKKSQEYCAVKRDLRVLIKDKTIYLLAPSDAQIPQDEILELHKELADEMDEIDDMNELIVTKDD